MPAGWDHRLHKRPLGIGQIARKPGQPKVVSLQPYFSGRAWTSAIYGCQLAIDSAKSLFQMGIYDGLSHVKTNPTILFTKTLFSDAGSARAQNRQFHQYSSMCCIGEKYRP